MDLDSLKKQLEQQINALQNKNKGGKGGKGSKGHKGHTSYPYTPSSYISGGGKGKGKGKESKGKGYGSPQAGKGKGKQAGGKGAGAGKGDKKGSTAGRSGYFKGNCGFCGKWGHRRADCRARQGAQGGINSVAFLEDWGCEVQPDYDDYGEPIWDTEQLMTYPDEQWDDHDAGAQDSPIVNEPGAEPTSKVIESLEEQGYEEAERLALQAQFEALGGGLDSLEIPVKDFEPVFARRQKSKFRRMCNAPMWGGNCRCAGNVSSGTLAEVSVGSAPLLSSVSDDTLAAGGNQTTEEHWHGHKYFPSSQEALEHEPILEEPVQEQIKPTPKLKIKSKRKPRANPRPNLVWKPKSIPELVSSSESDNEPVCQGSDNESDDSISLSDNIKQFSQANPLLISSFMFNQTLEPLTGELNLVTSDAQQLYAEEELNINELGEDGQLCESPIAINELQGEWEVIWITADSGAAISMMKEEQAQDYPILETVESKIGVAYTAANGGKVYDKGKRVPALQLENGSMKTMPFKVGKINKALCSVKDLCSAGNRVVFDDDGSYIENKKSGDITKIYEKGRTYAFPVQVVPKSIATKLALNKKQSAANSKLNQLQCEPSSSSSSSNPNQKKVHFCEQPFQRHAEQL